MKRIKADLHAHGPIGFQDYFLRVQGYEGKNLLKLIVDRCIEKEIVVCAITSEAFRIDRGSLDDRFGYLAREAKNLGKDYYVERKGDIFLKVFKGSEKAIYIVNSQTVVAYIGDKRVDHLVIGSNQVPNSIPLEQAIRFCKDNCLLHGSEHPFLEEHFGVGEEILIKHLDDYDFIEGHNSQLIIPGLLEKFPVFGKYNKKRNKKAKEFAIKHKKPAIAVSDAHRIEDIGVSYIEIPDFDFSDGEQFLIFRIYSAF